MSYSNSYLYDSVTIKKKITFALAAHTHAHIAELKYIYMFDIIDIHFSKREVK